LLVFGDNDPTTSTNFSQPDDVVGTLREVIIVPLNSCAATSYERIGNASTGEVRIEEER
jgi:hypothetical protein